MGAWRSRKLPYKNPKPSLSLSSNSEGFEQCWKGIRIGIKTLPVTRAVLQIHKHGCQRTRAWSFPLGQYFDHGGNLPENATYQSTINASGPPTPGFGAYTHRHSERAEQSQPWHQEFKTWRQQIRVWSWRNSLSLAMAKYVPGIQNAASESKTASNNTSHSPAPCVTLSKPYKPWCRDEWEFGASTHVPPKMRAKFEK